MARHKRCAMCKHEHSVHRYRPEDQGRAPPKDCTIPGCRCQEYSKVKRCPDCGTEGEKAGHQTCQYPQDR